MMRLLLTALFALVFGSLSPIYLYAAGAEAEPLHALNTHGLLNYEAFAEIPVLHDGRVKPLDTFARIHLRRMHGGETFEGSPAISWLAGLMFAPNHATEQRFFYIYSPRMVQILGLEERDALLYTYRELAAALDAQKEALRAIVVKEQNTLSATEKSLWALQQNVLDFAEISQSLSPLLSLNLSLSEEVRSRFGLAQGGGQISYLNLRKIRREVDEFLKAIIANKGDDLAGYTAMEQEVAMLSFALTSLESEGRKNVLLRVMPSVWDGGQDWFSPWQLLIQGKGSPQTADLSALWQSLAKAYQAGDAQAWAKTTTALAEQTQQVAGISPALISLEVFYNYIDLIALAAWVYGAGLVVVLFAYKRESARLLSFAQRVVWAGLLLHGAAIVIRIILLNRPPVSTLYESVLFVALISAAWGLWLSYRKAGKEGLLIASVLGGGLLGVSDAYIGQGDSMGVLIAVLNTNFWLATHVICISIGYGAALVAGTLAHVALFSNARSQAVSKLLPFAAVVALLFTAVGTMLGGVWADQSWGRFWGWDPKENGALLIVLWLVWLLHGRIAGSLSTISFAALLGLTNIVVMLSWFGVNLLNTGLHSYGFTDAAAYGLAAFCAIEIILLSALYLRARIYS